LQNWKELENNKQMEYKRLGDYIRPVDVRNRELKVTNLLGLSVSKEFMPSIANTIGTDMSSYKIVEKGQFVYIADTSRRGDKIAIALLSDYDYAIVSQAYTVFDIIDHNTLAPEYLMMWFRRPEFDRYARFHSHGSAREVFDWDELCNVQLPIPSIDRQCEIVSEYETLSNRIRLNEQMIANLEETAQALYRKMFVDGVDKENLPEGWRKGKLGEIADIKGGKRLPKGEELQMTKNTHPYIKVADMSINKYVILNSSFQYVSDNVQRSIQKYIVNTNDIILSIVGTIGNVNVVEESLNNANLTENCVKLNNLRGVSNHYLYAFLTSVEGKFAIEQNTVGGVQGKLPIYNIEKIELLIPSKDAIKEFNMKVGLIDTDAKLRQKENVTLTELQSLLLARMGK
jgi:type I restriction enzyme S subunit